MPSCHDYRRVSALPRRAHPAPHRHGHYGTCVHAKVMSQCEYNILVIARVRGGAEDECNNQDIVRAYPGYNWLLSHKPWQCICYLGNALSVYDIVRFGCPGSLSFALEYYICYKHTIVPRLFIYDDSEGFVTVWLSLGEKKLSMTSLTSATVNKAKKSSLKGCTQGTRWTSGGSQQNSVMRTVYFPSELI